MSQNTLQTQGVARHTHGERVIRGARDSVPGPGLNSVLQAEELPAGIAHLDTALADVDAEALTHVFLNES